MASLPTQPQNKNHEVILGHKPNNPDLTPEEKSVNKFIIIQIRDWNNTKPFLSSSPFI